MGRCLRWVYRWQVATSLTFDFENPLRFSFPPEVDADSLMQGAMQLSQAVLRAGKSTYNHYRYFRCVE